MQRSENAARDVGHGVASGAESATNEVKCGVRDVGQRLAGTHDHGDLRAEAIQQRDCERAHREAHQSANEFRAVGSDLRNNGTNGNAGVKRESYSGNYGGGPKR
jgi:hypothetical protein